MFRIINNYFTKLIQFIDKTDLVAIILSTSITLIFFINTDIMDFDHPHFLMPCDYHKYIFMAETGTFDFHIAPFY